MERLRVGIIGIGNISGIYLKNLTTTFSDRVELLGCADVIPERASAAAAEYNLPRTYKTPQDMLADPDIELVLNLTIPIAHYDVCLAAVEAGKHAYVEKPLCIELDEADKLMAAAAKNKVRVGGAPDTFLGAGIQTARKLIDDGWIGKPVAVSATMQCHGHESWHPDPEFYYKAGGGPMFDMGPYYLTALVNLVGPVQRVSGSTRTTFPQRFVTSEPKKGQVIDVDVPTHIVGSLEFANGAIGTIITSFDVWAHNLPCIEIYGTEGSLSIPDPNTFGGEVKVKRMNHDQWHTIPLTHSYAENSRGLGIADAADAIRNNRPWRASSDLTHHVLEIMHGIHIAADAGQRYELKTAGVRPEPLPGDFLENGYDVGMTDNTYEIADSRFRSIIARNEGVQHLYTGGRWLEGPVYFGDLDVLLFSDIPNDRILRYAGGDVTTFRSPSRFANGNTRDWSGRLVTCEHGARQVTRTAPDGSVEVLASHVGGKRLNSPNDVVVKRDGTVWFSDPDYGITTMYEGHKGESETGEYVVYRLDPGANEPVAVGRDFDRPNGLAFSPDESHLYVSDSGKPHHLKRFTVHGDNSLGDGVVFAEVEGGTPDGVRVDEYGNVWTSAGKGIQCYAPDGTLLGRINVPENVSNLEFGGPRFNRIFITATTSLYSIHVKLAGIRRG